MFSFSSRILRWATPVFLAGVTVGAVSVGTAATLMGSTVFKDVPAGSYFDGAVGRLNGAGIVKGTGDGNFHPGDFVTRADVAVMIDRAINGTEAVAAASSRSSRSRSSSSTSTTSSSSSSSSSTSDGVEVKATKPEAGTFRFAVANFSVSEGAKKASVSVVRSGGNEGSVTVEYSVTPGTATVGVDYQATSGTMSFADGENTKVLSVSLIDDLAGEASETFTIALLNPKNGAGIGGPSSTTVTILDEDGGASGSSASSVAAAGTQSGSGGQISFNAATYAANENGATITITVKRLGSSNAAVAVNYATSNGSATAGTHYTATTGTLSFAAGETSKSFTIPVIDNASIEGNKTVNLTLSNATNGAILETPATAVMTIWDEEAGSTSGSGALQFSTDTYSVLESVGKAFITVTRTLSNKGTVTVNFATNDGTAIAGADYKSSTQTLTFLPGEMSKAVGVEVIKDTTSEGDEAVNISLSSPVNATLNSPSTGFLKILSN